MPNHCTNWVRITSTTEKINKLVKDAKVDKGEFDFNAIVPMPEPMRNENPPSSSETSLGISLIKNDTKALQDMMDYPWVKREKSIKTIDDLKAHIDKRNPDAQNYGQQALDNLKNYGYKDWYDWSNANWGTKWPAYEVEIIEIAENHIDLQFDTAWGPPDGILAALEKDGFTVDGFWHEEGGAEDYIGGDGINVVLVDKEVNVSFNQPEEV